MKKELLHSLRKGSSLMIIALVLLFASCAIGYHDDETFNSGVRDTQLESPDLSKLSVKDIVEEGKEKLFIEWPVVYGAGGYTFSLYIVNDPENPILVGEENEIIENCSAIRDKLEDTKYEIFVLALGNEKDKNSEALAPSKGGFNTFVPTVAIIPDGTDLAEYFAENPIKESKTEQGYELVAGGSYTLNGVVDFDAHWITLHGTKGDNPKITYGKEGRLITWGGLKLKFIDFDCDAIPAGASGGALLTLSESPNDSIKGKGDYLFIKKEIAIQDCNIEGINQHLIYDNEVKYCVERLRIQRSVIALNSKNQTIFFEGGFVNDLYLLENTFYNKIASSSTFLKYHNNGRPERVGLTGGFTINNNTFFNIVKNGKMGDYNGMDHKTTSFTLKENIFVDCGKKEVVKRFMHNGGRNMAKEFGLNSYWYDGAFVSGEASASLDNGKVLENDPQLQDPANGNFTVNGADQLKERTGDPRWLPAVE